RLTGQLAKAVRGAKLKPLSAEIKGLSLMRLIRYLSPDWLKELEIVLDVGEQSVDLHIYFHGIIVFSRNVAVDKRDFLTREASGDHTSGFTMSMLDEKDYDVERYAEETAREIDRAVNFFRYSMNERERPVKRLVIVGQYDDSLPQRLAALTDFSVQTPD